MDRERENSSPDAEEPGDYGYDLAHEVGAGAAPEPPPPPRPEQAVQVATETPDAGGDLGYDLAHDVPPARRAE